MSDKNDYQYRAITKLETAQGNPLSLRYIRDMERNINNYRAKVGCHKLISDMWPIDSPMTSFTDESGVFGNVGPTDELVRMIFAPRYVPDGYNYMLVQSNHIRTDGGGTTTWRLHATGSLYVGSSASFSGSGYTYAAPNTVSNALFDEDLFKLTQTHEWVTNSGSNVIEIGVFDCSVRDNNNKVWFILTSQNSTDSTFSSLWNLDVTPLTEDIS